MWVIRVMRIIRVIRVVRVISATRIIRVIRVIRTIRVIRVVMAIRVTDIPRRQLRQKPVSTWPACLLRDKTWHSGKERLCSQDRGVTRGKSQIV
jgi:hypothetical protein